jgi:hypothetical protein
MGLSGVLSSLRSSFRRLSKVERAISKLERSINTIKDCRILTCPPLYELRAELSGVNADLTIAFTLVSKYQAVLRGIPLAYDEATIDELTACISEHGEQTVLDEFMSAIAGGTSLGWYLEDAEDEEIFSTYRAMGCLVFSEWEVGVHRAVWRAEERVVALVAEVAEMVEVQATK